MSILDYWEAYKALVLHIYFYLYKFLEMWKKTEHHPWAAVKTLLSKNIKSQKIPDKAEYEECRRLSKGKLRKGTRTVIKFHVKNIIARFKKWQKYRFNPSDLPGSLLILQ